LGVKGVKGVKDNTAFGFYLELKELRTILLSLLFGVKVVNVVKGVNVVNVVKDNTAFAFVSRQDICL
jgi:hypothetical protein